MKGASPPRSPHLKSKRILTLSLFILAVFLSAQPVLAAGITVDAGCSLANAIIAANTDRATGGCSAGSGADTITITAAGTTKGVITLSKPLTVKSNIIIQGAGFTISGGGSTAIFDILGNRALTLNSLTLRDGRGSEGGAINGYRATLNISSSSFINNVALQNGGAIYLYDAAISVSNSSFSANIAAGKGGAIYAYEGDVSVSGSSFSSNTAAGKGGALYTYEGDVTVSGSGFSSNATYRDGGAIWNYAGDLRVSGSSFLGNSAQGHGGAVYANRGALTVSNSTYSGNSASGRGSALFNYATGMTVTHATVLGSLYTNQGTLNLRNSILGGSITAQAGRIKQAGNLVGGDPKLGDKTGSPVYFPLLANSPAIDAADSSYCLTVDQRNVKRPQGNGCDIGAYEAPASQMPTAAPTAVPTATPIPTSTPVLYPVSLNGSACSLADAITAANSDAAAGSCPAGNGADTITFRDDVSLRRELPNISSDITFEGSGFSLSRYGTKQEVIAAFRLLKINNGATVAIKNLSLRNGEAVSYGGAIYNNGALTISGSTLRNNRVAHYGGAIYNKGSLSISNSTMRDNQSSFYGGAIYNADTLAISNSALRDNETSWYGGAIYSEGNLSISGSALRDNETTWYGGAIYFGKRSEGQPAISCALLKITNSIFSGNEADRYGNHIVFAGAQTNLSIDAETKVSVHTIRSGSCGGSQEATTQRSPSATPIPPTNTAIPSDTPVPPTNTSTPTESSTATDTEAPVLQDQQADDTDAPVALAQQSADTQTPNLLTQIDQKIARHKTTGRADLVAGFSAAREALLGQRLASEVLSQLNPNWQSEIWNRIRVMLTELSQYQVPPTNTPVPPTSTNTPLPPPSNTPVPPTATNTPLPPPTHTPAPPTATNTPLPPPTNTLAPAPQVDADLLAQVETKIAHHQTTGRDDLVAGFTAVRDAFQGKRSASDVLSELQSGWQNELWTRVRNTLEALR